MRTPEALHRLEAALGPGSGLVLVGGAVRDLLLGRPGSDWDLATALLPQAVMERARAAGFRCIPTGLQHGTVTVMDGPDAFEVTTYRGDGAYLDGRHPSAVRLGVSLEEDLARRDFTVNALALPARAVGSAAWREALVDPFGGRRDLEAGLLRAVGDPLLRFAEDGLRPLRACRFVAQLGFTLDPATRSAIPERLEVARRVAVERVLVELTKLLCGSRPAAGLALLQESGLMDLWMPELRPMVGCAQNRHHAHDVWKHSLAVVEALEAEPALRWAALLHDTGKPAARGLDAQGAVHFHGHEAGSLVFAEAILRRLKASNQLREAVLALVRHHGAHPEPAWSDAACRRFLARLEADNLCLDRWSRFRAADLVGKGAEVEARLAEHGRAVARLEALASVRPPLSARDLALDGRALMALAGRGGGPWLGTLQRHLLEQVLEQPDLNGEESLAELARTWLAGAFSAPAAPPPGRPGPRRAP